MNKLRGEVIIEFGSLFQVRSFGRPTSRVDAITDVADGYFFAGQLQWNDKGNLLIKQTGTGGPEYVEKIVGKLDRDTLIEALRKWIFGMDR